MLSFLQRRLFSSIPRFREQASSLLDILSVPNFIYIDKSHQIAEMMLDTTDLMFFNRPRRFGKSMILQGLEYFYNTRAQETAATQGRNLKILSSTPFGSNDPKNAIWSTYKSQLDSQNYVAIKLDFSNLKRYASIGQFQEGLHEDFCSEIKGCLRIYDSFFNDFIKSGLKQSLNAANIETLLKAITKESGIKLVLLIDEYEAPLMECLKPEFKDKYGLVEAHYNSFFSNIKAAKSSGLAKCVMTGVICLRNLSAFSDANSFSNLSLNEHYRETFGFTMKEIEEHPQIQQLLDFLLTNRPIPEEVAKMPMVEMRKHFISKLFEVYNGFRFTPESLSEKLSLISPISMVNHLSHLMESKKANPYDFKQYWAETGQTSMIKSLALNNLDPTESYAVLRRDGKENLDLEVLKKSHSIKDKFLPVNLLLFNTGYLTIRHISDNNIAELDWTNQETKEAFYEHYVDGLGFQINDLLEPLKSKTHWSLKNFMERLNDYFVRMLKKHYDPNDKSDNEHNHTFFLFLELLEYMPRSPNNKTKALNTLICHQYKLTQELWPLTKGKVPDLIFIFTDLHQIKQIVIVEFWY